MYDLVGNNKLIDLAYYAGLFDGEGCICIAKCPDKKRKHYLSLQVNVSNTNVDILLSLRDMFGGIVYPANKYPNRKQCWNWYVSTNTACSFLEIIEPYLHIKKKEAQVAIEFQKAKQNRKHRSRRVGFPVLTEAEKVLEEAQRDFCSPRHQNV